MEKPRALLGLHHELSFKAYRRQLQSWGFEVEHAVSLDEMLERCNGRRHDLYVMDLNLGTPASLDITPAQMVYSHLKTRRGEARFYGVSGNPEAVQSAQLADIPAVLSTELMGVLKAEFGKE